MIESNARIMKRNVKEYMNDDNTPQRTIECPAAAATSATTAVLLMPPLLLLTHAPPPTCMCCCCHCQALVLAVWPHPCFFSLVVCLYQIQLVIHENGATHFIP